MTSRFASIVALRAAGFSGFLSVNELRTSNLAVVPEKRGVYVVVHAHPAAPRVLECSPAGRFKGRNPTVPKAELESAWVPGSCVVYIGKAGGSRRRATLRDRLRSFLRFGQGARAAHWGGRATWQLADAADLLIAWRVTEAVEPRAVERQMIAEFVNEHGRRPLANRTG